LIIEQRHFAEEVARLEFVALPRDRDSTSPDEMK